MLTVKYRRQVSSLSPGINQNTFIDAYVIHCFELLMKRWILIGSPSLHNFYRLRRNRPPSGILIFRRHFIFYDCSLNAAAFCFTCEKDATGEPPFFEFKSEHHFSQLSYTEYRFRTSSIYPLHSPLITSSSVLANSLRFVSLHYILQSSPQLAPTSSRLAVFPPS